MWCLRFVTSTLYVATFSNSYVKLSDVYVTWCYILLQNQTVLFSIWSRAGAYNQTELAADIGPRILRFYEEYFNTSFPLPKQDMIAIPGKADIIQAIFLYGRLTINVTVVSMAQEVMILMWTNTLKGPLKREGWALKIETFLGSKK